MNKLTLVAAAVISVGLAGCSSNGPTKSEIAAQELEIQQMRAEAREEAQEKEQARMEQEMDLIPEWALQVPRADGTGFYGAGSSSDKEAEAAIRKSLLKAKYSLAATMKSELSGEETINGSGDNQFRYIMNNFVNQVELTGTEVVAQKVYPVNGSYKAHILIKMPYEQFNEVLSNQPKTVETESLDESYKRLMGRVNADSEA